MFGDCEGGKLGLGKEDLEDSPCDEPLKVHLPREREDQDVDDDDVETAPGSRNLDKVSLGFAFSFLSWARKTIRIQPPLMQCVK